MNRREDEYPQWICRECALDNHGMIIEGHISTMHMPDQDNPTDKCGWCGRNDVALTEPKDFGYPVFNPENKPLLSA